MSLGFCTGNNGNRCFCGNGNFGGLDSEESFVQHISRYIGQTVTIFTTSGGVSGCGFSGVVLDVNCEFVRISTSIGTAPANPLSESICCLEECRPQGCCGSGGNNACRVGSVCDIPINRIAAFCHNAI